MTKEIVKQEFTQAQLDLITRTVAQGATPDELKMFLHVCKKAKLDPFMRQIHFVKRGGKATIQVGIDGYRAIAERTGNYVGSDDPAYEYDENKKPHKASVTVYKLISNVRYAFSASAYWEEYKPQAGQDFMWNKMPHVMLGKVAEALALRKAFPNDLAGLYTQEEMAQANIQATKPQVEVMPPVEDNKNETANEVVEPISEELPTVDVNEEPATGYQKAKMAAKKLETAEHAAKNEDKEIN